MQSKPTLYMIGTTHFDPVWMWTWDEAMASIRSTFRSALDRMNEDPHFIYTFSCPAVFEWIRKVDPNLFAEIRQRVREGRWDLVEGWWVQPDCNTPSGESFVRQGLYGQRYLLQHFGVTASAGFNTDSFGHHVMLPQILLKSGMKAYVFGRPSEAYKPLPGPLFIWESPDGSRILAFRCGSDGANSYPQDVKASIDALAPRLQSTGADRLMLYGVSNHGGAPTREAIAAINGFNNPDTQGFKVCFSAVEPFFDHQDPGTLPVVADELQTRDFGVFINHTEVKHNNRLAEYSLFNAESLALLSGGPYPAAALAQAWKDVLFNQFHDIIGGASVKPAYVDARNLHGRALQTTREIIHVALQSITCAIDTRFEGFPLVVYNPNPFAVTGGMEAELQWAWEFPWYSGDLTLVDPEGEVVPCQVIQAFSGLPRFRSRFVFHDRLPPMGYKTYRVLQASQPEALSRPMKASTACLENPRYRIRIDPETGGIAAIEDKRIGKTILREAAIPHMLEDRGDTWAFNIDGFGPDAGRFKLLSAELIENGPVRSVLRTKARCADSTFEQDLILYRDADAIEGRFRVHWRDRRRALKLCFDTAMDNPRVTSAVPYGSIERASDGREMPAGEWLTLADAERGVSLLSDSVFAYAVNDATIGLTLLRSPIYAHHGHPLQRNHIDETKDYEHLEQGCREGRWQLIAHGPDWRDMQIPVRAAALNNPAITVTEANHAGSRPLTDSFMQVSANTAMVTVVKKAEDDDNIVLRLFEYAGKRDTVTIRLATIGRTFTTPINPHEIKTLMLDKTTDYRITETDLLERNR